MQQVTEIALEKAVEGVFTRSEVANWFGGSANRQFQLIKRALGAGEIVRIHRGLYCLAERYLRQKLDPLVLAQRVHGPSYISFETALSHHGCIPEAVYTITSASMDRAREFDTPLGRFSFTRVPQKTFYAAVDRVENDRGGSFLLASPLKALGDYVYVHKRDWTAARPVVESLRVDEAALAGVTTEEFDVLAGNYTSQRVRRFLRGLRKELGVVSFPRILAIRRLRSSAVILSAMGFRPSANDLPPAPNRLSRRRNGEPQRTAIEVDYAEGCLHCNL